MKAMVLSRSGPATANARPLEWRDVPSPSIRPDEVLIRVRACGVCHTDLDEIEGRMAPSALPRILGHQIVGTIDAIGPDVTALSLTAPGSVVAWLSRYARAAAVASVRTDRENLCPDFVATGRDVDGGYAEFAAAPAASTFAIPEVFADSEAAPPLRGRHRITDRWPLRASATASHWV